MTGFVGLALSSDGTSGRAGVTTCNNSYKINGKDILNEGFITSGGGSGGALGKYRFFTQSENNVDIPPWCNYLRIFLIGGGGGGDNNFCGGAGEMVLVELPVGTMSKYIILVGEGGEIPSPASPGFGNGHQTSFNSAAGTPFPYTSAFFEAAGGGGGGDDSGGGVGAGGGGGTQIKGPNVSNDEPLQVYARGCDAVGPPGPVLGGGIGAGSAPLVGGGIPPLVNEWDKHFGFYVGRNALYPQALVKELANIDEPQNTYGRGGFLSSKGMPGCACVFYFPHQPPPLNLAPLQ